MAKRSSPLVEVKKVIEEVKVTKNWKLLDPLMEDEKVKNLTPLSSLAHTDLKCLAELLYERGEILLQKSMSEKDLKEAIKALEIALYSDPQHRQASVSLARAHFKMALVKDQEEDTFLIKAKEYFTKSCELHHQQMQPLSFEALWDFGLCLYMIAKRSEEALDLKQAVERFQEACDRGFSDPEFLLDYATALAELGVLVGNLDILIKATTVFDESLKGNVDSASGWLRLACVYKILFFGRRDIFHFEKSEESFVAAARIGGQPYTLWLNWGQLLLVEGKASKDDSLLKEAVEKLETAECLKPEDPLIKATLGDALMHIGVFEENYDSLKDACQKFSEALHLTPNDSDFLRLYGDCLAHIGSYFSDPSYVMQAIDQYHLGMAINKDNLLIWHGLSRAHFLLGDLREDPNEFETSAKFCEQIIRLGGNSSVFWNDWGMALMKFGEETARASCLQKAIHKFEEAINHFNLTGKGYADPDWYYNLGCSLDHLGELKGDPSLYERAVSVFSRLLEQHPSASEVRYRLALALYHLGDEVSEMEILEMSLEHFKTLISESPEEENVYYDMGVVLLTMAYLIKESDHLFSHDDEKIEQYEKDAERLFFKSLALGGEVANYYLGCLYAIRENFSEAMHYMERAKATGALPPLEVLLRDEWLTLLRQTPKFRAFLHSLQLDLNALQQDDEF